ncbi:hypothetical protein [Streptomyces sp. NPDC002343]
MSGMREVVIIGSGPAGYTAGAQMIDDDTTAVDLTGDIKLLTDSAGTVHRGRWLRGGRALRG